MCCARNKLTHHSKLLQVFTHFCSTQEKTRSIKSSVSRKHTIINIPDIQNRSGFFPFSVHFFLVAKRSQQHQIRSIDRIMASQGYYGQTQAPQYPQQRFVFFSIIYSLFFFGALYDIILPIGDKSSSLPRPAHARLPLTAKNSLASLS